MSSSEKKRHSTLSSSWGLPTAAVHGVGAVAKKVVSNRLTESLWPSRKSSSSSHLPSDASSVPNAKKDDISNEPLSDHTSKTSLNVADEKTAKLPVSSSKVTPEREKTHLRDVLHIRPHIRHHWSRKTDANAINQSENLKPSDDSHVSTTDSCIIDYSENLNSPDGSDVDTTGYDGIDQSENPKSPDGSDVNIIGSTVIEESENLKPSDGSPVSTTSSNVIDHQDNSKSLDNSHVRLVNQHLWPGATNPSVMGHSVNSKPSENSKLSDGSHGGRLVNQQRWPGTIGSHVLNKSINPANEDTTKTCLTSDTGVTTPDIRKMLPSYANKPIQDSSSDAINPSSPSLVDDNKSERISTSLVEDDDRLERISNLVSSSSSRKTPSVTPSELQSPSPKKLVYGLASGSVNSSRTPFASSRGSSSVAPSKGGIINHSPIIRGVSLTPATREVTLNRASRGVSLTPATREVTLNRASRGVSLTPTRDAKPFLVTKESNPFPTARRAVSPPPTTTEADPNPPAKPASPPAENHTPISSSSPMKSDKSNILSNSTEETDSSPTKEISIPPVEETSHSVSGRGLSTTSTTASSPQQQQSYDSNMVSTYPEIDPSVSSRGGSRRGRRSSGSRLFFSSTSTILSMFTKSVDKQKEKNKEDARYLHLLLNIQVQWQFVNANAEAALDLQRVAAEKSLLDMWKTILKLWESVAAMKMDFNKLILQLKLYAILFRQMAYIDEWASIQMEYESAISVTARDLYARTLRLPTTEGVKVDVKSLKLVFSSIIQLMQSTASSIEFTLSKLDGTHILASELANIVSHERFLLDECEIFLASAAPLQIKECSLRSQVIQSKHDE